MAAAVLARASRAVSGGAIAVFAKTPGLSAVKTRLGAQIGVAAARAVYEASLAATAAVLRAAAADGWRGFFAPAEGGGGRGFWRRAEFAGCGFVDCGDGGLGARLDFVSRNLLAAHESAALIGGDSPQISPSIFAAARPRGPREVVLGPAADGGFYLFAAARPLPGSVWRAVEYSRADTCDSLREKIAAGRAKRPIRMLPQAVDIDDLDSLRVAVDLLKNASLPAQREAAERIEMILNR